MHYTHDHGQLCFPAHTRVPVSVCTQTHVRVHPVQCQRRQALCPGTRGCPSEARLPVLAHGCAHVCARMRGGSTGFNRWGPCPEHQHYAQEKSHACTLTQLTPFRLN